MDADVDRMRSKINEAEGDHVALNRLLQHEHFKLGWVTFDTRPADLVRSELHRLGKKAYDEND